MPDYVSLSNVFIDDILLSDGQMFLGVLGGAGVHAMAGARVWSDSLGLIASIGEDFNQDFKDQLVKLGLDLSMLNLTQKKTTRAWQIFQPDEERIEVFRDKSNLVHQISLTNNKLPKNYQNALGIHVHFSGTPKELRENLEILKSGNSNLRVVLEPSVSETAWNQTDFSKIFPMIDFFSPNTIEAGQITGLSNPEEMINLLIDWGAETVALRMGDEGSLLAGRDHPFANIPAISNSIIDVTGAGNAYLGGMLVGLCEGNNLVESALFGAVSASFAIEQFGVCPFNDSLIAERDRRLGEIKNLFETRN